MIYPIKTVSCQFLFNPKKINAFEMHLNGRGKDQEKKIPLGQCKETP